MGDTAQIRVVVQVNELADLGSGLGVYENQVKVTAMSMAGDSVSDFSDDGSDPDPNGNGNPNESGENDPTGFTIGQNHKRPIRT